MDKLEEECIKLIQQCKKEGFTEDEIKQLCYQNLKDPEIKKCFAKEMNRQHRSKQRSFGLCLWLIVPGILSMIVGVVALATHNLVPRDLSEFVGDQLKSMPCLLDHNEISLELTRPLFNCSLCEGLKEVPTETNLSQAKFEELYAYTSIPVVVRGTAEQWEARNVFSFEFFKSLYTEQDGAFQYVEEQCQFFPYNTDFRTLQDVFSMSKEMSELKQGKWYVGW